MEQKIKLKFLDGLHRLSYTNPVFVYRNNNPDEFLGTIDISLESNGHFGHLKLDQPLSDNLYLYYYSKNTDDGIFHLMNFGLHDEPRIHHFTATLKELSVQ